MQSITIAVPKHLTLDKLEGKYQFRYHQPLRNSYYHNVLQLQQLSCYGQHESTITFSGGMINV